MYKKNKSYKNAKHPKKKQSMTNRCNPPIENYV